MQDNRRHISTAMAPAIAGVLLTLAAAPAFSHGSVIDPPSREYFCSGKGGGDNPENPQTAGCKAAQLINGSQQFYDWASNLQGGHHEGQAGHQLVVPDGKICAGGKVSMRGLDAVAAWVPTLVRPNAEGKVKLTYLQSAGHVSNYFRTYITNNSYNFSRPIKWSDLQLVGDTGWLPGQQSNTTTEYNITVPAGMTGKRVLFNIWQRDPSDNAESFYSCSDVEIVGEPSSWVAGGAVDFYKVNTKSEITLRVFETASRQKNAQDLERHSIIVDANTAGGAIAVAMGSKVNASSYQVRLGALQADGTIAPVNANVGNKVFGANKRLTAVLERRDVPTTPEPGQPRLYVPGERYDAGEEVTTAAHGNFVCKQFPEAGWCSQSPPHYAPGTGSSWRDAWNPK